MRLRHPGGPLHLRKTSLQRLLARRPEGIFVNPFERGEIGPELFRFQSTGTGRIRPDGPSIGSRSRTARTRRAFAPLLGGSIWE
jgi:hypothetical protein